MNSDRAYLGRLGRMATAGAFSAALAMAAAGPAFAADGGGNQMPASPRTNSVATAYASIGTVPKTRMGTIWANTKVDMQCWADGAWSNGTNRWFFVHAPGIHPQNGSSVRVSGWISANKVSNQRVVPHC
ncbi:hypothetical protein DEJ50_03160 [Streptomyces venezuelae]|uniref:SH3 domain-containing protein n=1 Tax=Streptomyces venezuelae TaxID=54571 RepID=A0A5P2D0Z1_STRVZ|nr:hypothetical protein [Streptomyces venezuelae]QES47001.1 hypothetical protein DEJ50_03160 [Streptomyces venezuelae]